MAEGGSRNRLRLRGGSGGVKREERVEPIAGDDNGFGSVINGEGGNAEEKDESG